MPHEVFTTIDRLNLETFSPEITMKETKAWKEGSKTVYMQRRVQELELSLGMFQLVLLRRTCKGHWKEECIVV